MEENKKIKKDDYIFLGTSLIKISNIRMLKICKRYLTVLLIPNNKVKIKIDNRWKIYDALMLLLNNTNILNEERFDKFCFYEVLP